MRRKRNVWYNVSIDYNCITVTWPNILYWCPALKKWIVPDTVSKQYYCSNHYNPKTMSGALKMCHKLDMNMSKGVEIILTQWVIKNGRRMVMDYTYRRKNK